MFIHKNSQLANYLRGWGRKSGVFCGKSFSVKNRNKSTNTTERKVEEKLKKKENYKENRPAKKEIHSHNARLLRVSRITR